MHSLFTIKNAPQRRGFTLAEILVAVGLFSVVVTIAIGSLFSVINANRKSQALQSVMSNLNFALDQMSRDIRVGTQYHCGTGDYSHAQDCATGDPNVHLADLPNSSATFEFISRTGDREFYTWEGGTGGSKGRLRRRIDLYSAGTFDEGALVNVTAPEITIEYMNFYVNGTEESGSDEQPRVLITISGYAGQGQERSNFNIQTTISARILDRV